MSTASEPGPLPASQRLLATLVIALSNFMVVLDLTIAQRLGATHRRQPRRQSHAGHVDHHFLRGGRGRRRAAHRVAGNPCGIGTPVRGLHPGIRRRLAAVLARQFNGHADWRPHPAGHLGRSHHAAGADAADVFLPQGQAGHGTRHMGHDHAAGAHHGPAARRVDHRQLRLGLDLLHQRAGGHSGCGHGVEHLPQARDGAPESAGGRGGAGAAAGLGRRAAAGARQGARARLVRVAIHRHARHRFGRGVRRVPDLGAHREESGREPQGVLQPHLHLERAGPVGAVRGVFLDHRAAAAVRCRPSRVTRRCTPAWRPRPWACCRC